MFSLSTSSLPSVIIKSTYSEFKSLTTVIVKSINSDYRFKLLCWIKGFAISTSGLRNYFLWTSGVIGGVHFHTPRQTEPNKSPP